MTASFKSYLRAGYPCLWINTLEPARAQQVLGLVALETKGDVAPMRWDVGQGVTNLATGVATACPSPVEAVKQAAKAPEGTLFFLHNFHRVVGSLEIVQTIQNVLPTLKEKGNCLVILAPSSEKLPEELARVFTTMEWALPTSKELLQVATTVGQPYGVASPAEPNGILDAALGLTGLEAEDAFALSLVETGRFDPAVIAREKAGALLRQAKISLETYPERFTDLGGLDNLKNYTLRTARSPLSLGIVLLGVPGAGKSSFARALGNELGVPTLALDFGRMLGSLVGQSEAAMRQALQAVDAMGRVLLYIDEMDKGLAGAGSSGELDSGTKAGVSGQFLKWLSDRQPGRAYVVATANKVNLPPEYLRAERWDAMFYVDLPTRDEKDAIWQIHQVKFNVLGIHPNDTDWTGAEIRSCCRVAAMMGSTLTQAADYVVPVARSMAEAIEEMRAWAKGRCLPASLPEEQAATGRRLKLGR